MAQALDSLNLNIGVNVTGLGDIQKVQTQMTRLDKTIRSSSGSYTQASSSLARFSKFTKGALQQAGYQVGDYAVQVANGTSKMQAFGQQGAQLLGIFGPVGAVLGAGLAIYSAYAVAQEKMADNLGDANAAMEALRDQAGKLSSAQDTLGMSVDELTAKYGANAQQVREATIAQAELVIAQTKRLLNEQVIMSEAAIRGFTEYANSAVSSGQKAYDASTKIMAAFEVGRSEANLLRDAFEEVRDAQFGDEQVESLQRILALFTDLNIPLEKIPGELNDAIQRMFQLNAEAAALTFQMQQAAAATQNMSTGIPLNLQGFRTQELLPPITREEKPARKGGGKVDPLKKLQDQLKLEEQLLGMSQAQQRVVQALGVDWEKYSEATISGLISQIEKIDQFNKAVAQQNQIAKTIETSMSSAFMSIIDGTKTAEDAFKDMARTVIAELYKVLVIQRLVGSFDAATGKGSGIVGWLAGARAQGGPVTSGKPYIVGERGPELVVPSRNASVIPNNQLGGGGVTVIQNNTFGSGVSRAEIQSMLPKIVETTKAAVFDAQRRRVNGFA